MEQKVVTIHSHRVVTFAEGSGPPVLLVHGGPGIPSNYLIDSHAFLAAAGYRLVTWDQLGCGMSDKPEDPALWTIPRFVEEVETVRKALGLQRFFLLGHSWGGMLGLEYCFTYPDQVRAFIAVNTAFDLMQMQRGFERKKLALGEETCTMMARREAEGTTGHPEYAAAQTLLMHRHMCRLEEWPEALNYSFAHIAQPVLAEMFGPHFLSCTGNIRNYNWMDKLPSLKVPTLLIQGEHDFMLPEIATQAKALLPHGELALLRGCSHTPFYEDPAAYRETLLHYLTSH